MAVMWIRREAAVSPDRRNPDPDRSEQRIGERIREGFLRDLFEKAQPDLEAKASESMPRDLDALFEKEAPEGPMGQLLRQAFAGDLPRLSRGADSAEHLSGGNVGSPASSPARLDAVTASKLDDRIREGIREVTKIQRPTPIPMRPFSGTPLVSRAPIWTGIAAAGLLGMLYLWGQGYLGSDGSVDRPLFVLMDVDKPLNTSMDPGAISLAASGAVPFVESREARGIEGNPGEIRKPKKGGEE